MFKASNEFNKLVKKYEDNKLSHAFLIETNNVELCLNDIKNLIKVINCPFKYSDNCDKECNLCNLIDLNNLPSLITIVPDGQSIKKQQFEELKEKFSTKPVYSKYNSYIVCNAEAMNANSANAILKFLEEPEDYIIGFFITINKELMLDTIKSRCQIIKVIYEESSSVNDYIKDTALEYLDRIINTKDVFINKELVLPSLTSRGEINDMFMFLMNYYTLRIKQNYFPGNNSVGNLLDKFSVETLKKQLFLIEKVIDYNKFNVNIELLLDMFVIEMRKLHD